MQIPVPPQVGPITCEEAMAAYTWMCDQPLLIVAVVLLAILGLARLIGLAMLAARLAYVHFSLGRLLKRIGILPHGTTD
jgi:hypothetical protein